MLLNVFVKGVNFQSIFISDHVSMTGPVLLVANGLFSTFFLATQGNLIKKWSTSHYFPGWFVIKMYICKLYALLIWKAFDIFYAYQTQNTSNFFELHIRIIEFLLLKDDNICINIFLCNLKLFLFTIYFPQAF